MSVEAEDYQYKRMLEAPVKPLIVKLAIPTVISMLVTSIYNMADTYFVSQLGKSASGAVGVVFSLMAILQAVGFTLGMGSGSVVSRALGMKDYKKADRFASSAFYTGLTIGIILAVFGSIFVEPLMDVLGSTETALPYAVSYASYILLGAPVMIGAFILNNILRAEGKAAFSMIGLTTGGILNIILDPIFIYGFDMGIAGAAIATLISQCISFLLLLGCFIFKRSVINLKPAFMARDIKVYFEIIKTGAPSFCRQGLASISTLLLNNQAGEFGGDAALSGMSIVSKIFMFIFCIGLGIGQGYQPVAGYNYGARNWKRLREAYVFCYIVCTCVMTCFGIAAFTFAPMIIPLFIDDAEVIAIGVTALRFQAIAMPFLSMNVICNMTFQATGRKLKAVLLSSCRQGFFFIPCILILPQLFELLGVELTQAVSDLLTCCISAPFALGFYREATAHAKEEMEDNNKYPRP